MGLGGIGVKTQTSLLKYRKVNLAKVFSYMNNYIAVAHTDDIPIGERKRFEINGMRITIFNIDGEYYAINDICPHKGTAPLIRGKLDGIAIKCPNHGYRFDLKTGKCSVDPTFNTKIFEVKLEANDILLNLE